MYCVGSGGFELPTPAQAVPEFDKPASLRAGLDAARPARGGPER
jgi:hypothetical protein